MEASAGGSSPPSAAPADCDFRAQGRAGRGRVWERQEKQKDTVPRGRGMEPWERDFLRLNCPKKLLLGLFTSGVNGGKEYSVPSLTNLKILSEKGTIIHCEWGCKLTQPLW